MAAELSEYLVQCWKCNTKTIAATTTNMLADYAEDFWADYLYVVVECRVCYSMMLIGQDKQRLNDRSKNVVLWPQADQEMSHAVPESLRRENAEARKCFRTGAYTAAVVMVRRTLEGVCAENGI